MKTIPIFMLRVLLPCLILLAAFVPYASAKDKALAEITTKAGRLVLIEKDGKKVFLLNEKEIFGGTNYMRIQRFIRPRQGYDGLVVKDFTGPVHCPARYRLLVFHQNGKVRTLPEFDHCHPKPNISLKGQTITFTFPDFGSREETVWIFDGKKLKKAGRPASPKADRAQMDKEESSSGDQSKP